MHAVAVSRPTPSGTLTILAAGTAVYLPHIRAYLARHPGSRAFVATDSPAFLKQLVAALGDRVVSYDAVRSETNIFLDEGASTGYRKGEDVLMDALLLARCDFLLKAQSAVAEFATYFNSKLIANSRDLQLRCPGGHESALLGRACAPPANNSATLHHGTGTSR